MTRPEPERMADRSQPDDLDALFEVDHDMDNMFDAVRKETIEDEDRIRIPKDVTYGKKRDNAEDEEIKITKKRAPIAKLDDNRLLSDAGITKLQKISKTKFKFRGKGHEFSDVARLLRTYQLWLDDLYPRAKFADGLTIIEKLGHSKRIQVQRKAWIEESKPKPSVEDDDPDYDVRDSGAGSKPEFGGEIVRAGTDSSRSSAEPDPVSKDTDRLHEVSVNAPEPANATSDKQDHAEPDEDELDALLAAESDQTVPRQSSPNSRPVPDPNFDDDEEAMMEMGGMDDLW